MNNIRKETKKELSRNSWQIRIFKFVYGFEPQTQAYCVVFWASLFALVISPFVVVANVIEYFCGLFKALTPAKKEVGYKSPRIKIKESAPPSPEDLKRIQEKEIKKEIYKQKLVNVAKHLVFPAIIASVAFVGYLIYKFVFFVADLFTLKDFLIALAVLAGAAGVILLVKAAVLFIVNNVQRLKRVVEKVEEEDEIEEKDGIIKTSFSFIGAFITFIVDTVKIVYYKKCPLLVITDKTKPIEKIKYDQDS